MPERYDIESANPFDDELKQRGIEMVQKALIDFFEKGESEDFMSEDSPYLTINDVGECINSIKEDFGVPVESILSTDLEDPDEKAELCIHLATSLPGNCFNEAARIYFLESDDFAIAVSLIQTGYKGISLRTEPLEDCPPFIKDIWKREVDKNKGVVGDKNERFKALKELYGWK